MLACILLYSNLTLTKKMEVTMNHKACVKRIIEPSIKDCERRIALKQVAIHRAKKGGWVNPMEWPEIGSAKEIEMTEEYSA